MSLVIVESPAKCKKIQSYLGDGWKVVASMGHIRHLDEDLDAVGLDRDFDARFVFMKDKAKAMKELKDAARGMKEIYLASDDDREGEAIAFSVALLLGLNPRTAKRAVFHEITKTAIVRAVQEPRLIDMNRVDAQQARSILDMMVGFTISRLLWSYVGNALSAGRCQTPALRLICEREREIESFSSQRSWNIQGDWSMKGLTFDGRLVDELEDEESARNFLENIHADAGGTFTSSVTKPWTRSPPLPLITSTLQQEASAKFGSGTKRTMQIAQRLYEAGHITYMRTDHATLSEEAIAKAQTLVRQQFGDDYVGGARKKSKKEDAAAANAQEAHEAIRPTNFELAFLPANEDWNATDRKIYDLIRNRALQSVMAAARGEEHTVLFTANGDPDDFPWSSSWKRTVFPGWMRVGYAETNLDDEGAVDQKDSEEKIWAKATAVRVGDGLAWSSLSAYPTDTRPPPRYNEATLVRELEKRGIGRPSTFAMLVATIQEKEYCKKENREAKDIQLLHLLVPRVGAWPPNEEVKTKKVGGEKDKLVPTSLGFRILDFCLREFSNLFDYSFTSKMETRLDMIAEGAEPWKQLCRDTWNSYKDKYERLKKDGKNARSSSDRQKEFTNGLKAVVAKQGPLLLIEDEGGDKKKTEFIGWPDGMAFGDMTDERAWAYTREIRIARAAQTMGTFEDQPIQVKEGPFGKYAQCGDLCVPFVAGDTTESLCAKFTAKKSACLHVLGDFEFRNGPYGIYMFKKTTTKGKKPQFVGLPEGLDPKTLTEEAAVRMYQTGIQQKARGKQFAARGDGGGGGGARGRGGWRGRGRGRGGF